MNFFDLLINELSLTFYFDGLSNIIDLYMYMYVFIGLKH